MVASLVEEAIKFLRSHCDYTGAGLEHVDTLENEIIRLREHLSSIENMIGMYHSYGILNDTQRVQDIIYEARNIAHAGLKEEDETD